MIILITESEYNLAQCIAHNLPYILIDENMTCRAVINRPRATDSRPYDVVRRFDDEIIG